MSDPSVDWTRLNAYVDGELSPQEAASVANAAAADAEIARQISLLYKLKGDVGAALPLAPEGLAASALAPARRTWPRRASLLVPVAAVAALVAALLLAALPDRGASDDDLLASAQRLHARWLARDEAQAAVQAPALMDSLTRFGRLPVVPDLESTGLAIGLVDVFERASGPVLQIGYRGHRGCHLSMFVSAARLLADPAAPVEDPDRLHAWTAGELNYMLLARGMDRSRFDLIAGLVEGATRSRTPLDAADRLKLAENKRTSAPCQA